MYEKYLLATSGILIIGTRSTLDWGRLRKHVEVSSKTVAVRIHGMLVQRRDGFFLAETPLGN